MEIIQNGDKFRLIDVSNGDVLFQGSQDACFDEMCIREENLLYRDFLLLSGI